MPINVAAVQQMRAGKLAQLRWREPPLSDARSGAPLNFLSPETAAAFGIGSYVPIASRHYETEIRALVESNREARFLDLGAGLRHVYYANVVNVDIVETASTDVIAVGEDLPFADDQFDFVLCLSVLEHTVQPWDVAREMCRVLKPGGTLIVDWPFLQPVHGYPHHFYNATPSGNESLFRPYCDVSAVEVGPHHHPAIAARWILTIWRDGLGTDAAKRFESLSVGDLIRSPLEWQLGQDWAKSLDPVLMRAIPAGSRLTAVRRPGPLPMLNREQFRLEHERAHLERERAHLEGECSRLDGERERLLQECGRLVQRGDRLEQERDQLIAERDRIDRERCRLEIENHRLRHEVAAAAASLDIMRASNSWRVTGPLRAAARLFGRRP